MKRSWKKMLCTGLVAAFLMTEAALGGGYRAEAAEGEWKHTKSGFWFRYADGTYPANEWLKYNNKWYHFDEDGYMQTGWQKIGGKWYFLRNNGQMHTGWKQYEGKWYYLSGNGAMVTGWKQIRGEWYFFTGGGIMVTGWKQTKDGWYYFNEDGIMVTGEQSIDGKDYIFDDEGLLVERVAKLRSLEEAEVGDYVRFGSYEQDKDTSNGTEPIEWIVKDEKDGAKLLVSRFILDAQQYYSAKEATTYADSTVRTWLNDTFYKAAFDGTEKNKIQSTTVVAEDNPKYGTDAGLNTKDKVFLLSVSEATQYFDADSNGINKSRAATPTLYAEKRGVWVNQSSTSDWYYGNGWWWLRTPGYEANNAVFVNYNGGILDGGSRVNRTDVGIRPAIWVKP